MSPAMNELVGNLTFTPRGSRKITSETIDLTPLVETASESLELLLIQARNGRAVMLHKFVGYEAIDPRLIQKAQRHFDDVKRRRLRETIRVDAADSSNWSGPGIRKRANRCRDFGSKFFNAGDLGCGLHLTHAPFPDSIANFLVERVPGLLQRKSYLTAVMRFVSDDVAQKSRNVWLEAFHLAAVFDRFLEYRFQRSTGFLQSSFEQLLVGGRLLFDLVQTFHHLRAADLQPHQPDIVEVSDL